MIFIGVILFILIDLFIILSIKLKQSTEINNEIKEYNEALSKQKENLETDINVIYELMRKKDNELQLKISNISSLDKRIDDKQKQVDQLSNTIQEHQQVSENAFTQYFELLNQKYDEVEQEFDNNVVKLREQQAQIVEELDKMCQTRAAAHEAILREQEVKDNKEFYALQLSELEKRDIKLLNSIKKDLINERPVNMIIWQTYYSKKANELCARVLGTSNKVGIYKITQISTNRCYIGQSKNVKDRFREHMKCGLGIDTPSGNKLYQAMLQSSIEDFTFELLEECNSKDLDEKEKYFIELYQSYDYGFNSNRGNG